MNRLMLMVSLILLACACARLHATVVTNEFMASNNGSLDNADAAHRFLRIRAAYWP
jgi:hypothetical protein